MTMKATTSTAGSTHTWTATLEYVADPQLIRAIQSVRRKAAKWKRDCCGKKAGKRHCESFGCASLDELLAPLKRYRFVRKKSQ